MDTAYTELLNDPVKLDQLVRDAFVKFDTNNNGTLEKNEVINVVKAIYAAHSAGEPTNFIIQAVLAEFDTNDDGVLSLDEFRAFFDRYLKHNPQVVSGTSA